MDMVLERIVAFLKHPAGIAVSLTAILSLIPKVREVVLMPAKKWWAHRRDRDHKIDTIFHQVLPNNSSSIPDQIQALSKQMTNIVRQGEESLARIIRVQGQMLAMMDLDSTPMFAANELGHFVWVNRAWCEMVGMRGDDALKSGWYRALHPSDKDVVVAEWRLSVAEGRVFHMPFRYKHLGTGKEINAVVQTRPQLDNEGKVLGHLGAVKILYTSGVQTERRQITKESLYTPEGENL